MIFELFSGESTKNRHKLRNLIDFIDQFRKIELTVDIARKAGELCRDFKKTIQVQDYIIAASALSVNAEVVTLNTKHFEKIPGLRLYPI